MSERLKWINDCADTRFGRYMLNKCRIRNGQQYETEYEVYLDAKMIGISDTRASGKMIARAHFNVQCNKAKKDTL